MHVVVRTPAGEREVTLRVRAPGATVGDLLDALDLSAAGLDVDGRFAGADLSLVVPQVQDDPLTVTCTPTFPAPQTVEVACTGRTDLLFAPALGPAADLGEVSARARATARTS